MTKPKRERSPCPFPPYVKTKMDKLRRKFRRRMKEREEAARLGLTVDQMTIRRLRAENREMRAAIKTQVCGMCFEHTPKACKGCSWWEFTKGIKA